MIKITSLQDPETPKKKGACSRFLLILRDQVFLLLLSWEGVAGQPKTKHFKFHTRIPSSSKFQFQIFPVIISCILMCFLCFLLFLYIFDYICIFLFTGGRYQFDSICISSVLRCRNRSHCSRAIRVFRS